jgi:hypothetical protein
MKFLITLLLSLSLYASGPDFLVLGAQKGGTTSLYGYLKDHPSITMPSHKELHFFDKNFDQGIEFYLDQFPSKKKLKNSITGDVTPRYLPHPDAPKRAYSYFPKSKLIVLLRNPVDRAFSRYKENYLKKKESRTFEQCIQEEVTEIKKGSNKCDLYLERGLYAKHLKNWLKFYPKEQLLVIISEDFFAHTQKCMDKIYDFLELAPHTHKHFSVPAKKAPEFVIQPKTRELLEEFYRPHNKELQKLFDELNINITLNWNKS